MDLNLSPTHRKRLAAFEKKERINNKILENKNKPPLISDDILQTQDYIFSKFGEKEKNGDWVTSYECDPLIALAFSSADNSINFTTAFFTSGFRSATASNSFSFSAAINLAQSYKVVPFPNNISISEELTCLSPFKLRE